MERNAFFEVMQYALGNRKSLSHSFSEQEWSKVIETGRKHKMLSTVYYCIQKMKDENPEQVPAISRQNMLRLVTLAEKTININEIKEEAGSEIVKRFESAGFNAKVLKGQANKEFYERMVKGLFKYRSSGDIDLWVWKKDSHYPIRSVIEFCKEKYRGDMWRPLYHHLSFNSYKGIEVEVHYRPSWMSCMKDNRRLQKFFEQYKAGDVSEETFQLVFQLAHIYQHLLSEGVGIRQLMDFYMIDSLTEGQEKKKMLTNFNLYDIYRAVRYVNDYIFRNIENHDDEKRRGQHLLEEVMRGGNFGAYNESEQYKALHGKRGVRRNIAKWRHLWEMVLLYPSEVISEPLFRLYHALWRTLRLWYYE